MFLANLLQGTSFNMYLNLPGYLAELGADEAMIGLVFALTALAAIACRPAVGRAMDRRGRRPVFLAGGLVHTGVALLYQTVETIGPWVGAIRIVHGLAEAMLFSALYTYAADLIPASRRTEGIALFGASGLLSISLGGAIGEAIEQAAGYPAMFGASVGMAFGSWLVSLPLRESVEPGDPDAPTPRFRSTLRQRDLLPLWWVTTVFATALAAAFTFTKTFVLETGIGSLSAFFGAYSIAGTLLRIFFARVPDRVGPKRMLYPSIVLLGVGFLMLAFADDDRSVVAAGILCGLGHGYTFPILMGLVVSRGDARQRGAAMAIFTALFDAGMLVGGPSFGLLIQYAGYPVGFASGAVLLGVGSVVFAAWERAIDVASPGSDGLR